MLEIMKEIAVRAGSVAFADNLRLSPGQIHAKDHLRDLVTDTDRKIEIFITEALRQAFPDCGIFGEETGRDHAARKDCFIIDPVDGTTSFIHHLPNWCVSIGLQRNGQPEAGVVYAPVSRNLYYAQRGCGAFLNGRRLHVSGTSRIQDCVAGTGFSCLRAQWTEENNLPFFCKIAPEVSDVRKYGSAALDCCHVASGSLDFFWELFLHPYDVAAGVVILQEAGGTVSDLKGGDAYPGTGSLCNNGLVHNRVLQYFRDYRALRK